MALPLMSTPTYTLTVPSTEQKVKYRPFLVKEEKALLLAQQSEDVVVMIDSLRSVIQACVLDKIDMDKLATFDLEYMFTQIRAKSVGETIELLFGCDEPACVDDDKARVKLELDLTTIQVEKNVEHTKKYELFDEVGVVMKYPSIDVVKKLQGLDGKDLDRLFEVVADCVDFIYQGDEIYHSNEIDRKELMQFLNNLTTDQFVKLQSFFITMPKMKKEVQYTCPVCKTEHKRTLEGIQSFF